VIVASADAHRLIPDCKVSVDGKKLALDKDARLTRVDVDLDVDLFSQCSLVFNDPKLTLINGPDFKAGVPVKVEIGFASKMNKVFEGEVVALEPQFRRDLPPALRVVCQESMHRLALETKTRALNQVDDKEIVKKVAQDHGLTAVAPSGSKEHVLQSNVSDAVFLRRIAQKHGNHVRVEGGKLIMGPPPKGAQITVAPGAGLKKLRVRFKAGSQVSEISIHGWDPKTKKEIVGKAKAQGVIGEGSQKHGAGTLSFAAHEHMPEDVATAQAMAKGRIRKIAEGFVTAQAEMIGNAGVLPGAELTFSKMGEKLDGTYRVEKAHHEFSKHGYFTSFHAVRVAKKKPPSKAPAPLWPARTQPPPAAAAAPTPAQQIAGQNLVVKVVDSLGNPKPNFAYRLVQPGAPEQAGMTDEDGFVRATVAKPGQWKLLFPDVDSSQGAPK